MRRRQTRQVVREAALLHALRHPNILVPTAVFTEIFGGKLKAFVETPFQASPPNLGKPHAAGRFFAALLSRSVRGERRPFSRIPLGIIVCRDGLLQGTR